MDMNGPVPNIIIVLSPIACKSVYLVPSASFVWPDGFVTYFLSSSNAMVTARARPLWRCRRCCSKDRRTMQICVHPAETPTAKDDRADF